jgi:HAD superfamily phosphoserine phosphatase-like hydrolase
MRPVGGKKSLLLFVHGIGGGSKTWGAFSELIAADHGLDQFDVDFFEYPAGVWSWRPNKRSASVQLVAEGLHTAIENHYANYDSIVLVAHSLGGLVVRKYLVDRVLEMTGKGGKARRVRVSKALLYAVPNNGAGLANLAKSISRFQRQLKQLCPNAEFLEHLNSMWRRLQVGDRFDIQYVVAARDAVVDVESARGLPGLDREVAVIVDRDHRSCVKPSSDKDLAYEILRGFVLEATPRKAAPPVANRLEVVGFDLDGTLLRGMTFSWTEVWGLLKYSKAVSQYGMRQFLTDKWSYQQWCEWAIEKFRDEGLKRSSIQGLAANVTVTNNLRPALERLRKAGFRLVLISGGIDVLLEATIPDAEELFDNIFINRLEFDDDDVISAVKATPYDFEGKVGALELAAGEAGCTIDEAVFVGDGFNDASVSKRAGLSIAYPPSHFEQSAIATYSIQDDDLMQVADLILNQV